MTLVPKESRMWQIQDLQHAQDLYDDDHNTYDNNDDADNAGHDVDGGDNNSNVSITPL